MKEVLPFQEHQSTIQMKIELGIKSFPFFFFFFFKERPDLPGPVLVIFQQGWQYCMLIQCYLQIVFKCPETLRSIFMSFIDGTGYLDGPGCLNLAA